MEANKVFRDRILAQFTNYRKAWRNPSTHDYNLDFDEDEAFLATVSVSAFTKLLVDSIAERLSFDAVKTDVVANNIVIKAEADISDALIDRVTDVFQNFIRQYAANNVGVPIESEAQLMGALSGFFASVAPDLQVTTGRIYRSDRAHYIDMVISKGADHVVIELKRGQHRALVNQGLHQLAIYMEAAKANKGLLFLYSGKSTNYSVESYQTPDHLGEMRLLRPSASGQ